METSDDYEMKSAKDQNGYEKEDVHMGVNGDGLDSSDGSQCKSREEKMVTASGGEHDRNHRADHNNGNGLTDRNGSDRDDNAGDHYEDSELGRDSRPGEDGSGEGVGEGEKEEVRPGTTEDRMEDVNNDIETDDTEVQKRGGDEEDEEEEGSETNKDGPNQPGDDGTVGDESFDDGPHDPTDVVGEVADVSALGDDDDDEGEEGVNPEEEKDPFADAEEPSVEEDEEDGEHGEGEEETTGEGEESRSKGPSLLIFRNETELDDEEEGEEEGEGEAGDEGESGQAVPKGRKGEDEETIEMEGEPQIADPVTDPAEASDPFDPLSAAAGTEDSIVVEGQPGESAPADEATVAEAAAAATDPDASSPSDFLEKVNSGTFNSAQFMTAIIDLPEKERKPRTKKTEKSGVAKRKRNVSSSEESLDSDGEYEPSKRRKNAKKRSVSRRGRGGAARKSSRASAVPKRSNARRDALFGCEWCDFKTETIGELNIHTFGNHDSENKPTFLDMAEATVAKLDDRHGTSKASLLKNILTDYGHVVECNVTTARRILASSLRRGIELGRVSQGIPGKKGAQSIFLPSKENRRALLARFSRNPIALHVEDIDEDETPIIPRLLSRPQGGSSRGRQVGKSAGYRKQKEDDDEICVVEEKLTPMARMKAKAYANAKAALAKKLPSALLRSVGGGTKMVRIGPGGVVRAEGGRIVTTLGSRVLGTGLGKLAAAASLGSGGGAGRLPPAPMAAPPGTVDDDDDDLTCNICMSSFWYKNELMDHLKSSHSVEDPVKHLKSQGK